MNDKLKRALRGTKPFNMADHPDRWENDQPNLSEVFLSVKDKLNVQYPVELRVGDLESIGMGYNDGERRIVFIQDMSLDFLNRDELAYLVGHELGHIIMIDHLQTLSKTADNEPEEKTPEEEYKKPPILASRLSHCFHEMCADMFGVAACGNMRTVATFSDNIYSVFAFTMMFDKDEPAWPPSDCVELFFEELIFKNLILLSKSKCYPEILANPLLLFTCEYSEDSEFEARQYELYSEVEKYSNEDNDALTAYTGAALFVMSSGENDYIRKVRMPRIMEDFQDFDPSGKTLEHASADEALKKMDALKDRVRQINHPLKHEAFSLIAKSSFSLDDDDDLSDQAFLHDIGSDIGIDYNEIRENVNYGRGRCW